MMLAWWWPHVQISSYQSSRHLDMSFFISDISIEVCGAWQKTLSVTTRGLFPPSLWYNHHHLFFKWDFDLDDCIAFKISHHAMLHGRNSEKSVDSYKIKILKLKLFWFKWPNFFCQKYHKDLTFNNNLTGDKILKITRQVG